MSDIGYVLVVDDMPANHAVVQGMLKKYNIKVDCVKCGPEAIDLIRDEKTKYNAVFMDQMMPEMDGMETTRIIRQELGKTSEYARTIPIIALTGNAGDETEELFIQAGFNAFLTKPVKIKEMDAVLCQFMLKKIPEENQPVSINPNMEMLIEEGGKIPGLDIRNALEKINWDWETCIEVIKSFVNTTPALLETCKNISPETLPQYCITVHGIKSVAFSFGAMEAGKKAKALEDRSMAGDFAFVRENNEEFIQIIKKLLQDLAPLQEIFSTEKTKPQKEKPDTDVLAKILEAAENYNIRNLEEGIGLLDEYKYTADTDLVPWLKAKSMNSDFMAIYERLSKIKK